MNTNKGSHGDTTSDSVLAHSFVVRALREPEAAPGWHGFVTDVETGERRPWHRAFELARFIEDQLAVPGAGMTGPALTDVVGEMLAVLGARLPGPLPTLPEPNVTLERVAEKLVGIGNHRGTESTGTLGTRTVRGGRLDARVRFQIWGGTASAVDTAVLTLHSDLLDDRDVLRGLGFLKLNASGTTLAEHVDPVGGWRKTTSFDALYEYSYVDSSDADSLITRIQLTTDPERAGGPGRERETETDSIIRWDSENAPPLVITGPMRVDRITALAFDPGPPIGGQVRLLALRSMDGTGGPIVHLPDLATFLAATGGAHPAEANADVTLTPAELFTQLGAAGPGLDLGDWNTDGVVDSYAGFDRPLDQPIVLPTWSDRLICSYLPPGPGAGLDQTAVVYLRVNSP
ncbi:hypothetical protein [Amycolatopsis nigrescens]|uniref:hypothetical protein n=1 Tax=Amycolatopsis nigrescens TaxID=381445 RepID=UPI0012FCA9D5|nr:hypothetical protein [Amycolatopsis nigrescens]